LTFSCHQVISDVFFFWHLARDFDEDFTKTFKVRGSKLDPSVQSAWANQSSIQRLSSVGSHDDLHIATIFEPVQLVKELKERERVRLIITI
jgi:phosphosulfolactate phosphohydrolase-like enzyme